MAKPRQALRGGDALNIVDAKTDVRPGGALAVESGDEVDRRESA